MRNENDRLSTIRATLAGVLETRSARGELALWGLEADLQWCIDELGAKQADIDRLMLEYCPDEMSVEQRAEWGRNQRPASPEQIAAVEAALAGHETESAPLAIPSGWQGKEPWFKVGDKVTSRHSLYPSVSTVTGITERGFKFTHPRININAYQWSEGGETFEPGMYELASENGSDEP